MNHAHIATIPTAARSLPVPCPQRNLAPAGWPETGTVHVWRLHASTWRHRAGALRSLLCVAERARADRLCHACDRMRFTISHGVLRLVLARRYLRTAPVDLVFKTTPLGKPRLIRPRPTPPLHFNLAHSDDAILVAVATSAVGIDVERIRIDRRWADIAGHAFSASERTRLNEIAPSHRPTSFFHGWVRKEAYLKARGVGLSFPPSRFTVSLEPGTAGLLAVTGRPADPARWTMAQVEAGPAYCAAVVLAAPACHCRYYDAFPPDFLPAAAPGECTRATPGCLP